MTGVAFNELADNKFSVSVPGQPPGEKLSFRQKLNIAGTRYKQTNQPAVLSHSIRWKAVRGLWITGLISLATNAIDFTFGDNKDKGIKSNEFLASSAIDFIQAGVIGVGSAMLVGGLVAFVGLSAPLWVVGAATALVGIGIGAAVDRLIDTDKLKDKVAKGFSALDGIFQNSLTIAKVGAQRLGERVSEKVSNVKDTVLEAVQNAGDSIKTAGNKLSDVAQDVKDKIGGLLGGMFGTGG